MLSNVFCQVNALPYPYVQPSNLPLQKHGFHVIALQQCTSLPPGHDMLF